MARRGEWVRELICATRAPTDQTEGCYRVIEAFDGWHVVSVRCRHIAGPYASVASARRRARAYADEYDDLWLTTHPAKIAMGRAEEAALRRARPRPRWH